MKKCSVLILQRSLSLYNIPAYELLSNYVALTVAYTHNDESKVNNSFGVIRLKYRQIGNCIIVPHLRSLCMCYDVIIFMPDMHYLSYIALPFYKNKFKTISWSIGIRASYTRPYNLKRKKNIIDKCFGMILKKADANIFYMKEPIEYWRNFGINISQCFVAHNTVEVSSILDENSIKDSYLFVGTLYREKNVDELIETYFAAYLLCKTSNFPILYIIGKGPELKFLMQKVKEKGMEHKIIFCGAIYDESLLSQYFMKALICISPNQAGLSVLKSLGYGVPYITREKAITGGEIFNIINNETGILYNSVQELQQILLDVAHNPTKYIMMGKNSKKYYESHATMSHMVQGFLDAIKYVLYK